MIIWTKIWFDPLSLIKRLLWFLNGGLNSCSLRALGRTDYWVTFRWDAFNLKLENAFRYDFVGNRQLSPILYLIGYFSLIIQKLRNKKIFKFYWRDMKKFIEKRVRFIWIIDRFCFWLLILLIIAVGLFSSENSEISVGF